MISFSVTFSIPAHYAACAPRASPNMWCMKTTPPTAPPLSSPKSSSSPHLSFDCEVAQRGGAEKRKRPRSVTRNELKQFVRRTESGEYILGEDGGEAKEGEEETKEACQNVAGMGTADDRAVPCEGNDARVLLPLVGVPSMTPRLAAMGSGTAPFVGRGWLCLSDRRGRQRGRCEMHRRAQQTGSEHGTMLCAARHRHFTRAMQTVTAREQTETQQHREPAWTVRRPPLPRTMSLGL